MGLFVKICGITNDEDARGVSRMRPDAVGFIFWPKSPRYVEPTRVAELNAVIDPAIRKVGVFVDASPEEVSQTVRTAGLDVVQLHGNEDPGAFTDVADQIWRVVHLDRTTAAEAAAYRVDGLLIDRYSTEAPGGTGLVADWTLAADFVKAQSTPVLLAGGLNPDNLTEAVSRVVPWGVDVSSGVEERPGKKDLKKVQGFIDQCRKL